MTRSGRWKLAALGALAATAFAAGAMSIVTYAGGWVAVPLADVYDRRAYDLLNRSRDPAALDRAEVELNRALGLAPYSNTARLRLAYIDSLRHGTLSPAGRSYLSRSYDLVALDHTVAAWRIKFALEHWRELTPSLRDEVQQEAMAFGRLGSEDADVRAALKTVQSPEGRVAAGLWAQALNYAPRPAAETHRRPISGHSQPR